MNLSVNFASGHQDEESTGEEFDIDSEREEAVGDDSDDEPTFVSLKFHAITALGIFVFFYNSMNRKNLTYTVCFVNPSQDPPLHHPLPLKFPFILFSHTNAPFQTLFQFMPGSKNERLTRSK